MQGIPDYDIQRFKHGFLNVTVLQIVDKQSLRFGDIRQQYQTYLRENNLPDDSDVPVCL
jgi:hypothetical protein